MCLSTYFDMFCRIACNLLFLLYNSNPCYRINSAYFHSSSTGGMKTMKVMNKEKSLSSNNCIWLIQKKALSNLITLFLFY